MSCCVLKPLNLCDFPACGDLFDTQQTATESGIWKLKYKFLGAEYTMEQEFDEGDALIFMISNLNEAHEYLAQILKPDDSIFTFTVDDVQYDGLQFHTVLSF
jgi:hypothetical protein